MRWIAFGNLAAVIENDNMIGNSHDHFHVVLDEQNGDARRGNFGDQMIDLLGFNRIAARRRFVQQQDLWRERQRARYFKPLQRSIGKRSRFPLGNTVKTDTFEKLERARSCIPCALARRMKIENIRKDRPFSLR